jgi:4-hydroxy-3-polyprenylbenzoate decarboxylase
VAELATIGAVQQIDAEVDRNLDVAAIIRRSYDVGGPAQLFTNIRGYKRRGFRILGAPRSPHGWSHPLAPVALALGLPAETPRQGIIETLAAARNRAGIPPVNVDRAKAPCKENVLLGEDVDLHHFPIPSMEGSRRDRNMQCDGVCIATTPDGSWIHWSVEQMTITESYRLACLIPGTTDLGIIRAEWAALGESMPVVLALGVEPGLSCVGAMPQPAGADKSHFLGALFGEGIELVPAETVNLPVPANAEIVVEGFILAGQDVMRRLPNSNICHAGTDFAAHAQFMVSAITYRHRAILPVVARLPAEEDSIRTTMHAAEILHTLRGAGLPVASTWFSYEGTVPWLIVSIYRNRYETTGTSANLLARRIGEIVFTGKAELRVPNALIVETDIDMADVNQVVRAFTPPSDPGHDSHQCTAEGEESLSALQREQGEESSGDSYVVYRYPPSERPNADERQIMLVVSSRLEVLRSTKPTEANDGEAV